DIRRNRVGRREVGKILSACKEKCVRQTLYGRECSKARTGAAHSPRPGSTQTMSPDDASRTIGSLFESWYSSLVRYAFRAIGDIAVAEDLVQETFMQLYRELRQGRAIEKPKAWTLCVLRREIGKHIRRHTRIGELHEPVDVLDNLPAEHFRGNKPRP